MIVVSDTTPLNYLVLIGQVDLLPSLFKRVIAPPAVLLDMLQTGAPASVAAWAGSPPPWLEVIAPSIVDSNLLLGDGEVEAICLAQELRADCILIDERKATAIARKRGLIVAGTLNVLAMAAEKCLVDLPAAIATLRQTNFRGPADLIDELLKKDEERRNASE